MAQTHGLRIPFYKPGHQSLTISLVLLMSFMLLLLTGLGVFRLYFEFDWTASQSETGQLFSLRIRGGQSLNVFEAEPFGLAFWLVQSLMVGLCLMLPLFNLLGGSLLTLMAAAMLLVFRTWPVAEQFIIPLEYELLTLLVLYLVYVLSTLMFEMREQKRIGRLLSQFVPDEVADEFKRDPNSLVLSSEERMVSVLFCDVRDFSSITQRLDTPVLAQWLNLYFSHVSKIVIRHRGSIDKYMGDSVMAVWGAPVDVPTHAYDALQAALDIQQELHELNALYRSQHWPEVSLGIGISSGPAMVGPLGSEFRMDYTVVGDTVNVAQRLEAQTRKYQVPVIVSDKTASDLPELLFRELDTICVKGRSTPVTMYEPLGKRKGARAVLLEQLSLHEQAMQASKAGRWDEAQRLFTELRDQWGPAGRYEQYLKGLAHARTEQSAAASPDKQPTHDH